MCENPNQVVSSRGCIDNMEQACDSKGSSIYWAEHGMCMTLNRCPEEMLFEGCRIGCRSMDFFDPNMA